MVINTAKMSAKQFLMLGEDPPGVRLELANGQVAIAESWTPDHSFIVTSFAMILGQHNFRKKLGELFCGLNTILDDFTVRRPDVQFISNRRLEVVGELAIEGAPDLAIEVMSHASRIIDRRDKFRQYELARVKHYWIVDPRQRTIEAYRLRGGKFVGRVRGSGSDVVKLPPFVDLPIPLAELWRPKAKRSK